MGDLLFIRRLDLSVPVEALRDWHFRPGAFERLVPPWERATVVEPLEAITDGAKAVIEVRIGPLRRLWVAEHDLTPAGFVDRQIEGPFAFWEHDHRFEPLGESASRLTDTIRYRLPLGWIGRAIGAPLVARRLDRLFRYRHAATLAALERESPGAKL